MNKNIYAVVLAGGGGTRLWPKSREKTPKQFLKLISQKTMIQVTADRLNQFIPWENIIVMTNKLYVSEVQIQLPQLPITNIIAEPEKKDTALAMLIGSLYAKSLNADAVVVNGACDHAVTDEVAFVKVMQKAVAVAEHKKHIISVGITPSRPDTAFGYIKIGKKLPELSQTTPVYEVLNFTEKPDIATAQAYIATGKYFWNANMYVWHTDVIVQAFEKYMPSMYDLVKPLFALQGGLFRRAVSDIYKKSESISIDYAISEKADNLVLIPGNFGWDDVGDWKVVFELGRKNKDKNVIIGTDPESMPQIIQSHGNLIHTDKRRVVLVGINNMIVVDTPEIVMILPKERSQDVKKIVEMLKKENKREYL